MPRLILTEGPNTYTLEVDKIFRIGRHPDNDLPLKSTQVSRWHAEIRREQGHYKVIDLDSLNGTWVNKKRIQNRLLRQGDMLQIGEVRIVWHEDIASEDIEEPSPFVEGLTAKSLKDFALDEPIFPARPGVSLPAYAGSPEHLHLLLQMSSILNDSTDLDHYLDKVLDLAIEAFDANRVAVLVREGTDFSHGKTKGREGDIDGEFPASGRIVSKVMGDGVAVLASGGSLEERFGIHKRKHAGDIGSAICAPLWRNDKSRGVIYLDNVSANPPFDEEDLYLASAVANSVVAAIKHFRAMERSSGNAVLKNRLERRHCPEVVDYLMRQSEEARKLELAPKEHEVTVMLCDIVDFGSISESLSAADSFDLLGQYYSEMRLVIFEHNGSVGHFRGESLTGYWGAPLSRDDDPRCAVLCAADMLRSLYRMLKRIDAKKWFKLRVAIRTGAVMAGLVNMDYTLMGKALDTAKLIQAKAKPNQVLIDERTRDLIGSGIPTVDIGYVDVENAGNPFKIYELAWKEVSDAGRKN